MRALPLILLLATLAGLSAATPDPAVEAARRGRLLFEDTQDLQYPSCAQCHSLLAPKEEARRAKRLGPGFTLYGAAMREAWRNGELRGDFGLAFQHCAKIWQRRKKGLDKSQTADLVAYLRRHGPAGPLPIRKVAEKPRLISKLEGGDAAKGKALHGRYCLNCHNDSEESLSFPNRIGKKTRLVIARKVRGFDAKGVFRPQEGTMSYYLVERLPDEDLRHILAYLAK